MVCVDWQKGFVVLGIKSMYSDARASEDLFYLPMMSALKWHFWRHCE